MPGCCAPDSSSARSAGDKARPATTAEAARASFVNCLIRYSPFARGRVGERSGGACRLPLAEAQSALLVVSSEQTKDGYSLHADVKVTSAKGAAQALRQPRCTRRSYRHTKVQ